MDDKSKLYYLNDLINYYNEFVIPTMESNHRTPSYIKRTIITICLKLNLIYYENANDVLFPKKSFEEICKIFKNRKEYFDGKINLYSSLEVGKILNISIDIIYKLVPKKILNVVTIIGSTYYFYCNDVDSIKKILSTTYSLDEVENYVRLNSIFSDLPRYIIPIYIKKNFNFVINPINKRVRLEKNDLNLLIEYINKNYRTREKCENLIPYLKGYGSLQEYKYIDETSMVKYMDYNDLRNLYKKYNGVPVNGYRKAVKHFILVCKFTNVVWFTNKKIDNIYILKSDRNRYIQYYIKTNKIVNSDDYYLNTEVQKKFNIINTDRIAEYAGYMTIGNNKYIKKDKINELLNLRENTISISDLSIQLNINKKKLSRVIKKAKIDIIKNNVPIGLEHGFYIFNKDIDIIKELINTEKQLKATDNLYEKFIIKTKDVEKNRLIPKTLKAFDDFICLRFKNNNGEPILNALVYIYKNILSTLNKEIMKYKEETLYSMINLMNYQVAEMEFIAFLELCNKKYSTVYKDYFEYNKPDYSPDEPYSKDTWFSFAYLLFDNKSKIYQNNLEKALESRLYSMIWLYCAIHYVCCWRAADIMKKLPFIKFELIFGSDENEFLNLIINGKYNINIGQSIINYVMQYIKNFERIPGKKKTNNHQILKFVVSERYVYTIGMLLGLCEYHRRKAENDKRKLNTSVLITETATKKANHIKFFGDTYKNIFGDNYFRNINATKSFMVYSQIISQEKGWGDWYYILGTLRGHTPNSIGRSDTTQIYLENINKSNDIDKITYALTERGIFGFLPYQLLTIIEGKKFKELSIREQSNKIKELAPLKATDIEIIIKEFYNNRTRAKMVINELLLTEKDNMKNIISKISLGLAPSKMKFSQCLVKAINKSLCLYSKRTYCVGCEGLIPEIYFLFEFNLRLLECLENIKTANYEYDRRRYSYIFVKNYLYILNEAILYFGKERVATFINVDYIENEISNLYNEKKLILE